MPWRRMEATHAGANSPDYCGPRPAREVGGLAQNGYGLNPADPTTMAFIVVPSAPSDRLALEGLSDASQLKGRDHRLCCVALRLSLI